MKNKKRLYCKTCGGELKRHDAVKRIIKTEYGKTKWIFVERYKCKKCGTIKRFLPDQVYPYKHYEKHIIDGFMRGELSEYLEQYEDYPCEQTIKNWFRNKHNS